MRPESAAVLDRLEKTGVARPTSRSAASPGELRGQLAEFRQKGYAVELEETLIRYGSVAVPVRGSDGEVHAAISATLPVSRLHVARLVPQLHAAAVGITRADSRTSGELGDHGEKVVSRSSITTISP